MEVTQALPPEETGLLNRLVPFLALPTELAPDAALKAQSRPWAVSWEDAQSAPCALRSCILYRPDHLASAGRGHTEAES